MKGHRFIGTHPDELDGGQPVEPGQFIADLDLSLSRNKSFVDDGLLIEADIPDEVPEGHPETLTALAPQEEEQEETPAAPEEPTPPQTRRRGSHSTSEEESA